MAEPKPRTLDNLIHEADLCEALRVRPRTLAAWRRDGLPYVRLHMYRRAYWAADVERYLTDRKTRGTSQGGTAAT